MPPLCSTDARAVAMRDMAELVGDDAGELVGVLGFVDQAAKHVDDAARQRDGIGVRLAHHRNSKRDRQRCRRFELGEQLVEGGTSGLLGLVACRSRRLGRCSFRPSIARTCASTAAAELDARRRKAPAAPAGSRFPARRTRPRARATRSRRCSRTRPCGGRAVRYGRCGRPGATGGRWRRPARGRALRAAPAPGCRSGRCAAARRVPRAPRSRRRAIPPGLRRRWRGSSTRLRQARP